MRPFLSSVIHLSGWFSLFGMSLIVWVFGSHLWPLLLIPLPLFLLAIIVALAEMRISDVPLVPRDPGEGESLLLKILAEEQKEE